MFNEKQQPDKEISHLNNMETLFIHVTFDIANINNSIETYQNQRILNK